MSVNTERLCEYEGKKDVASFKDYSGCWRAPMR
jgi:hypothetical protein